MTSDDEVPPNIVAILRDIAAADETSMGLVGLPTVQMYAGMAADEIERLRRRDRGLAKVEQVLRDTSDGAERSEFHRGWVGCCQMALAAIDVGISPAPTTETTNG